MVWCDQVIHGVFKKFPKRVYKSEVHRSHYVLFEQPCNLTISYTGYFVPDRSDIPLIFYNRFRDRVCC
jgi:hypothetical protein